eukprot:TRINITY_DN439_c0_g1_i6.p1 TRINITY_DN439_c0_g1~~TRINITY_DN439_c0_g1_i6.p1  ORF type:complete len:292 (-),score=39.30 TRINITY_DN439_c0_g1_i6:123-998(-)
MCIRDSNNYEQYKETPQFSKFIQRFKNGLIPQQQSEIRTIYSQSVDNNQGRYQQQSICPLKSVVQNSQTMDINRMTSYKKQQQGIPKLTFSEQKNIPPVINQYSKNVNVSPVSQVKSMHQKQQQQQIIYQLNKNSKYIDQQYQQAKKLDHGFKLFEGVKEDFRVSNGSHLVTKTEASESIYNEILAQYSVKQIQNSQVQQKQRVMTQGSIEQRPQQSKVVQYFPIQQLLQHQVKQQSSQQKQQQLPQELQQQKQQSKYQQYSKQYQNQSILLKPQNKIVRATSTSNVALVQ